MTDGTRLKQAIARRLAMVSLAFALVAGVAVYFGVQSLMLYMAGHVAREYVDSLVGHHGDAKPVNLDHLKAQLVDLRQFKPFDMVRIYDASQRIVFEQRYRNPEQLVLVAPLAAGEHPQALPAHRALQLANHGIAIQNFRALDARDVGAAPPGSAVMEFTEVVESAEKARLEKLAFLAALVAAAFAALIGLVAYPALVAVVDRNAVLARQVEFAYINLLKSLGIAISRRDSDTGEHCYRTTLVAIAIGEQFGLERVQMRALIAGSLLHDIGKIAIDDAILRKPGKFTPEEMAIMRGHVKAGVHIAGELEMVPGAADVVAFHHERWDGKGYPYGMAGSSIPLLARIFAVADVFDALCARRKYKEPFPFDRATALIREGAGTQFDADVVAAFVPVAAGLYGSIENRDEAQTLAMLDAKLAQYFSGDDGFELDDRL